MIFNQISALYSEIKEAVICSGEERTRAIDQKINNLACCLRDNSETLTSDLKDNKDHALLYEDIRNLSLKNSLLRLTDITDPIEVIELKAIILEINEVLQTGGSPLSVPPQVLRSNQNPLASVKTLKEIRKRLVQQGKLTPEFDKALSKLSAQALGLHKIENAEEAHALIDSTVETEEDMVEAIAHWINAGRIPLKDAELSVEQLKAVAPHLHYVDSVGLELEDLENFIYSCVNAYHLFISSPEITKLDNLPLSLQKLEVLNCPRLETLDVSKHKLLKNLMVTECPLKALNVSQNTSLQKLVVWECAIEALDVSQNTSLQKLEIQYCPQLKALDIATLKLLQKLWVKGCPVEALDVSKLTLLQNLWVKGCPVEALDVSKLTLLQWLNVSDNPNLKTLLFGDALPHCHLLSFSNCPQLDRTQALPQLPFDARVYGSQHSNFVVKPLELEKESLKLLLKLGKHLSSSPHMPNVVWWDSETDKPALGIDVGGLRRQLVTTLCENLFKEGSGFAFTNQLREGEDELTGKLPLLTDPANQESIEALQAFARLIARCSTKEVQMGAHLPPNFYHALASLTDEEIDSVEIGKPLDDTLKTKILLSLQYIVPAEADPTDLNGLVDGIALPVAIVAKELKSIQGFSLGPLRRNARAFVDFVQGKEVTKELLKANMLFEGDDNGETKKYFDDFIDIHPTQLKDLVELFTSCRTIGDKPIMVKVFPNIEVGKLPIIHTCSQEVEMPSYQSYEQFEKKLLLSLTTLRTFEIG